MHISAERPTQTIRRSELVSALSHALDITEGHPAGHCVRSCWIGMQVGAALGLAPAALATVYYAILLKDIGCSSNAARICELYLADDIGFKRDFKRVNDSLPQILGFVLTRTGMQAKLAERFRAILNIARNGGAITKELFHARCQTGGEIVRQMRFPEEVARGVMESRRALGRAGTPGRPG